MKYATSCSCQTLAVIIQETNKLEEMKSDLKKITTTIICLVLFSSSAFCQEKKSDAGGPPTLLELIGFWKKVDIPNEEKMNQVNPWPQKYQWFAFYENGKVYSMMADEDENYTSKQLSEIFSVLPSDKTPNYELKGQFLTVDNKEIKDYQEVWGVNLFAKNINGFLKKGRLIMSLDDGNGNVIYYRLLEKVQ